MLKSCLLLCASGVLYCQSTGPAYSVAGLVNSASQQPGYFAPGSLATLYGENLASFTLAARPPAEPAFWFFPTAIGTGSVRVGVGGRPAPVLFVSPRQINFIVLSDLLAGETEVEVVSLGRYGPSVKMTLTTYAPAFFDTGDGGLAATGSDGRVIAQDQPARPGEWIAVYLTGLGNTTPPVRSGEFYPRPVPVSIPDLLLQLNGTPLPKESIAYAGITPLAPSVYQVNFKLPSGPLKNPEIRIRAGGVWSKEEVRIPVEAEGKTAQAPLARRLQISTQPFTAQPR